MGVTRSGRPAPAQDWLDLAALLDPAGIFDRPPGKRSQTAWRELFRLATAHLVAPSLHAALAARGRLGWLPEEIRDALEALHQLNTGHNDRLREVLRETTQWLNGEGITPIALKGAIALLPDQYPLASARVLGDLDLAVAPGEIQVAEATLRAAGYTLPANIQRTGWNYLRSHHAPPLLHPSRSGYVELHRAVLGRRVPPDALPLEKVSATAVTLDWNGVRLRVPALAHRLVHNSLHHQIQNQVFASDRRSLRQHFEFASLRLLPGSDQVDWARLLRDLDRVGMGDALRLDLLATRALFGQELPVGVSPSPAALAVEGRFWWRLEHPRMSRWMDRYWRLRVFARRLPNLPGRLITPGWYPAKLHALRHAWFPARDADEER